jgi:1-acyl-sn-glycerol-3-phosphate acyltransferase
MKSLEITKIIENKAIKGNEPDIQVEFQAFWQKVFDIAFTYMLNKAFYSVRVKNAENFELRDKTKGSIIFASHCCWWDGFVAYLLCRKVLKTNMRMMIEELYRFPLLSRIGGFSVEKDSPQSAIKALNYCTEFLNKPDEALWIYPQGSVMPPDHRPIEFAGGTAYICSKMDGINLIPIAHRYNFLREDRPEIFVEVGKPIILTEKCKDRKALTSMLEREFTNNMEKQRKDISEGKLEGYELFLKSRLCITKLIEKNFTWFVRSFIT